MRRAETRSAAAQRRWLQDHETSTGKVLSKNSVETLDVQLVLFGRQARDTTMRNWDWRPILVLPAAIGTLAVVVLVFAADADHATQFFGSFTAAIVAAVAVVVGANYQSQLTVRREEAAYHRGVTEQQKYLYGYIQHARDQIRDVLRLTETLKYEIPQDQAASPDDRTAISVGTYRTMLPDFDLIQFDTVLRWSSNLPDAIAAPFRSAIVDFYRVKYLSHVPVLEGTVHLRRDALNSVAGLAKRAISEMDTALSRLENHLAGRGVLL